MISPADVQEARRYSLLRLLPSDSKLKKQRRGFMTNCTFHDDTTPSMSLTKYDDGVWRYKCFGCGAEGDPIQYLVKQKGIEFMDAVRELTDKARTAPIRPVPVAFYDYLDESGKLLYQVVRKEPKGFSQRRPSDVPGQWIYDLCGVRRVLYRLPKLLMAQATETVYYVEGEKDVETLEKVGLLATTHAGGAGSFRPELLQPLKWRRIVVVPDRDEPGMSLMRKVFAAARDQGSPVGFLLLPHDKDSSDYFGQGGTLDGFLKEVR